MFEWNYFIPVLCFFFALLGAVSILKTFYISLHTAKKTPKNLKTNDVLWAADRHVLTYVWYLSRWSSFRLFYSWYHGFFQKSYIKKKFTLSDVTLFLLDNVTALKKFTPTHAFASLKQELLAFSECSFFL